MKCQNCGQDLQRGSKFCPFCGAHIEKKQMNGYIVAIICALAVSICANGYFVYQYQAAISSRNDARKQLESVQSEKNSYAINLSREQDKVSDLTTKNYQLNREIDQMEEKLDFLRGSIGFITPEGKKYHTFDCYYFLQADEYWAHNIEYCGYLGYTPCSVCH